MEDTRYKIIDKSYNESTNDRGDELNSKRIGGERMKSGREQRNRIDTQKER
jgi:hypothetical protein